MDLIECPVCRTRIEPTAAGTCPACQAILAVPPALTSDGAMGNTSEPSTTRRDDQWLAGCTLSLILGSLGSLPTGILFIRLLPEYACGTGVGAFLMMGMALGFLFFSLVGAGVGAYWASTQCNTPSLLSPPMLQKVRVALVVLLMGLMLALGVSAPGMLIVWGPLWVLGTIALVRGGHIGNTLGLLIVAILATFGGLILWASL